MADNNEKSILEELEALKAEKYNLLKLVSHDIRSPFNRIYALLQLFEMGGDELPPDRKMYINSMYLSILSGLEMIQNLKDMREIDAGNIVFEDEEVDLVECIRRIIKSLRQRLELKKLSIEFNPSTGSAIIRGDEFYTGRVLENIISNAIKFSKEDAKVIISLDKQDNGYEVVVRDFGEGIKLAEEDMLFKKFKKLSTVATGGEGSVGLGLYNSSHFAKKMNGKVYLRRSEGEIGSSFVINFPQ